MIRQRWTLILLLLFLTLALTLTQLKLLAKSSATVSGIVIDANGPVSSANVRVRATENVVTTTGTGLFTLSSLVEGEEIEVTAWSDGYYVATTHVTPTIGGITLTLRPYHTSDNPDYPWASPIPGSSPGACGNCHPMILPQWQNNAHGTAVSNPRFFTLYNGTDLSGSVPVAPGYRNDFPSTAGTCAGCHAPGAAVDGYLSTNMNDERGSVTAGIHCDYCHKIGGVFINPATQSFYPNAPGVSSQQLLRPPQGDNIFFGPFDDIHDPDTYLPLISESQFCGPCHQFSFWGTPIYESYEEWLASPYADSGITCQKCHMLPNGDTHFALPEVGGLEHPPDKIPSHLQLGASDLDLLQNTVSMSLTARQSGSDIAVSVTISNTGAGHHVPTDFPGRHMILVVEAVDRQERPLPLKSGPLVPGWGGSQAGLPGTAYAKLLRDVESGDVPVVSYWKQTLIAADNRIPALAGDRTTYTFSTTLLDGPVQISARLLFRRLFQDLADQKSWDKPDILMEVETLSLTLQPEYNTYLPLTTTRP